VIYLHRRDTLSTACELLRQAQSGAQTWLVVPWGAPYARDPFSLKRLQRTAEQNALDLRLVCGRATTRAIAREAGLAVYAGVPLRLLKYRRVHRPERSDLGARVVPVGERLSWLVRRRPRALGFGAVIGTLFVVALMLVALAGTLVALVPSAEINLAPVADPVIARFDVTGSPLTTQTDYARAMIPARMVQVIIDGTGETPASGSMPVAEERASGWVVFVNRSSSPVLIPKGTVVRTGSGISVRFFTVADVQVPGQVYGHARVGILAMEPGREGNVAALTISVVEGELATAVEVLNDQPTEGGSVSLVPKVAVEDFDRLAAELRPELGQQGLAQLGQELREGEFVVPESLEVLIMSQRYDQVIDQRSDVLSMSMKVVVRAIALDGNALRQLAVRFLESQSEEGLKIIDDSLIIDPSDEMRVEEREVFFSVTARGSVAQIIDVQRVQRDLRGKPVADVAPLLGQRFRLRAPATVAVTPDVWEYMPILTGRITVRVTAGEQ
jgi:hypothetical protein